MITAQYSALVSLLENLIDYAGLFPPASLPPQRVAEDYLSYLDLPARFALGRLIWPAARLDQLPVLKAPVTLSALLGSLDEFPQIVEHNARKDLPYKFDCVELRWNKSVNLRALEEKWGYWAFFEVTPDEAQEAAAVLPHRPCWGLKLRTGGLVSEAIPTSQEILKFLEACHNQSRPYKFTAGLHHVLPGTHPLCDGPAPMHGFLNLFLASALHWRTQISDHSFIELMTEADPTAFNWQPQGLGWRNCSLSLAELRQFRRVAGRSFGCCSFLEPINELLALDWLAH